MSKSTNNFTKTPLDAHRIYIGSWDNVIQYASAFVNLNSDTDCELTMYLSSDKGAFTTTVFQTTGGVPYTNIISLQNGYVYFTVRNKELTAQTYLNFDVIYRDVPAPAQLGTINTSDATTHTELGEIITKLNDTLTVSEPALDSCIKDDKVYVEVAPATNTVYHLFTTGTYQALNLVSTPCSLTNMIIATDDGGSVNNFIRFYDTAGVPNPGTDSVIMNSLANGYVFGNTIGAIFTKGIGVIVSGGIANGNTSNINSNIGLTLLYDDYI